MSETPLWIIAIALSLTAISNLAYAWYSRRTQQSNERMQRSMEKSYLSIERSEMDLAQNQRESNRLFKESIEVTTGRKIKDMTDAEVLSLVREPADTATAAGTIDSGHSAP